MNQQKDTATQPVSCAAENGESSRTLPRQARHDLRSHIGQVIGYSELWLDEISENGVTDVEALCRDLERIRTAGRKLLDLTNQVIDPISQRAERFTY